MMSQQYVSVRFHLGREDGPDSIVSQGTLPLPVHPSGITTSWKTDTADMAAGSPATVAHTCTVCSKGRRGDGHQIRRLRLERTGADEPAVLDGRTGLVGRAPDTSVR